MHHLILLTPMSRPENLPTMLDSIHRVFDGREDFQLLWVIVKDKYNCHGDPEPFYEKLREDGLPHLTLESGKPDQKNYGGDILNDALQYLFDNYKTLVDPWVYVFDDDNVLHPLIPFFVSQVDERFPEKFGIWLTYQIQTGNKCIINGHFAFAISSDKYGHYVDINNPDPSSIFLKLSVYKYFFPIKGGIKYDYEQMRPIVEELYDGGNLVLQNDIEFWRDRAGTFHNGIAKDTLLKDPENRILYLVVDDATESKENLGCQRFVVPKEANEEIINVLKKYNYAIIPG